MADDIYRLLQQKLDQYSIGFPATESGIEIKILKRLFDERDAKMFLAMSPQLKTPKEIAEKVEQPVKEVSLQLNQMTEKGLLFRVIKPDRTRFSTIAFVHGLFEFQVKRLDPSFAEMVGLYDEEAFDNAMLMGADYFLRTIPVNQSVELTQNIAAIDDAMEILKSNSKIVVTDCICRKRTEVLDHSCGKPLEVCFMFGSMGQYYLDQEIGREVQLEEAISIIKQCHESGLVTQPATSQNPGGMCNCCGDCCGVLKALKTHPKPAEMVFSNYQAFVDSDECSACEDCLDRCQMEAISMSEAETAEINLSRCIGCGLCVTSCPTEAILLKLKPGDYRLPPKTTSEQMMLMAQKRGLL